MINTNSIEFGVFAVETSSFRVVVDGRCYKGPIFPGQIFKSVSEMSVFIAAETCGPTTLVPIGGVDLKIESIWAYGRQIEELSPCMTARLELSGSGIEKVRDGVVLS